LDSFGQRILLSAGGSLRPHNTEIAGSPESGLSSGYDHLPATRKIIHTGQRAGLLLPKIQYLKPLPPTQKPIRLAKIN